MFKYKNQYFNFEINFYLIYQKREILNIIIISGTLKYIIKPIRQLDKTRKVGNIIGIKNKLDLLC